LALVIANCPWLQLRFNYPNQFVVRDRRIEQIGLMLLDELQSDGFGNRLCVESLRNLLAVHLLRCYSNIRKAESEDSHGLCASQIHQVIEFINENLAQNLQVSDIAAAINLSVFHFTRLFKQSTGVTPHQYVIQQRVAKAEQLLKYSKLTIVEVAHEVGFSSQSHFHHHFKRLIGVTPKTLLQQSRNL
jgi:AraC family transcriptional regulator